MFWEVSKWKIDICSGGFLVSSGSAKENCDYRRGGFFVFWEVSKWERDICSGGFLVAFGSTILDVTLSFGVIENTKISIGRVDFGWFLEAQNWMWCRLWDRSIIKIHVDANISKGNVDFYGFGSFWLREQPPRTLYVLLFWASYLLINDQ